MSSPFTGRAKNLFLGGAFLLLAPAVSRAEPVNLSRLIENPNLEREVDIVGRDLKEALDIFFVLGATATGVGLKKAWGEPSKDQNKGFGLI